MINQEFQYYLDNQQDLVAKYNGKTLVIKDLKVVGVYNSEAEAYTEASKQFAVGTFLIQKCQPGKENYTQTFHTRASFNL